MKRTINEAIKQLRLAGVAVKAELNGAIRHVNAELENLRRFNMGYIRQKCNIHECA